MKFFQSLFETYKKNKFFYSLLLLVFIIQFASLANHMNGLETIPTCIYGCAPWMSQGFLKDLISDPTNIWKSDGMSYQDVPAVMPKGTEYLMLGMYYTFGPIFGWDYFNSWKAIIPLTLLSFTAFFFLTYNILNMITQRKELSLVFATLINSLAFYPIFMYSSLVPSFLFLLCAYLIYYASQKQFSKRAWTLFILFFILGFHIHPGLTVTLGYTMAASLLIYYFKELRTFKIKEIVHGKYFQRVVGILAIAGIISIMLPWWNYVLFDAGGNIAQDLKLNDSTDVENISLYFSSIPKFLKSFLFNFSTLKNGIISILIYFGIFGIAIQNWLFKKQPVKMDKTLVLVLGSFTIAYFIAAYHYLLTAPLLGKDLTPFRSSGYFLKSLTYILAMAGVIFIWDFLKNNKLKQFVKNNKKNLQTTFAIILVIILSTFVYQDFNSLQAKKADRFYSQGYDTKNNFGLNMYENLYYTYFEKNDISPESAIVITTNELSMTLHNIVGTNNINGRYGYFYQYLDYRPYWSDVAIMLYSDNNENRQEILKKYSSYEGYDLYVYWDYFWLNSEYNIDMQTGQLQSIFNPLKFYGEDYKQLLIDNNISYYEIRDSFEPNTYGRDLFRKFDLAVVSPQNYRSIEKPWDEDLDQYLTKVWSYSNQGKEYGALYKVTIN